MGVLGAGKYLVGLVGFDELADRATLESGFFPWFVNILSSHPVLTWRAAALRNRTHSGHLFFRPGSALPKSGAHCRSVELRILVAGPLELEEVGVAGQRDCAVPHLACVLAARDA